MCVDSNRRVRRCGAVVIVACLPFLFPVSTVAQERASSAPEPEVVSFSSGALTLGGVLYKPEGSGPFPVLIYNHGSAPGMWNNKAFEQIGPLFIDRDWVFFAPYRRGQGLSASAGPFILDEIARAQKERARRDLPITMFIIVALLVFLYFITRSRRVWLRVISAVTVVAAVAGVSYASYVNAGATAMVELLETDHLDDHLAALDWLKAQSFIQPNQIATGGNSFGGIVAVLGAERTRYCAAVDAAGGASSWSMAPQLRTRMMQAVRNSQSPILFFQAANDYTLAPSRTLSEEMLSAGKTTEIIIYPAFGKSAAQGHSFAWRGSSVWIADVFQFLHEHCVADQNEE